MLFSGVVIHGKKQGRILGYPTANVALKENTESGVWAGRVVVVGEEYRSAIFIHRDRALLEAHLLDFEGDIYGQEIEVRLERKIRDAIQFSSLEELKKQIAKDVTEIQSIF